MLHKLSMIMIISLATITFSRHSHALSVGVVTTIESDTVYADSYYRQLLHPKMSVAHFQDGA